MKALIAMSGGVDSSVAALLIKNQGYDAVQKENFGEINVIRRETADVQQ